MSRRPISLIGAAGLLVAGLAIAPIALAGDPCFHEFDNRPAPSSGATSHVVLGDCVFTPTVNSVPVGTTVTWRNGSSQAHEVVGSNMTWGAHDKLLEPGDTIGWTFEVAGTYGYSCMIHPGMTGVVVVGDGSEAAAAAGDAATVRAVDAGTADGVTDGGGIAPPTVLAGVGGLAFGLLLGAGLLRRNRPAAE